MSRNNNLTSRGTVLLREVSDEVSRRESARVSWRNLA